MADKAMARLHHGTVDWGLAHNMAVAQPVWHSCRGDGEIIRRKARPAGVDARKQQVKRAVKPGVEDAGRAMAGCVMSTACDLVPITAEKTSKRFAHKSKIEIILRAGRRAMMSLSAQYLVEMILPKLGMR